MFLPFLAALSALFDGVERKPRKHPKAAKTNRNSEHKKEAKTGKKRRSMTKQDKGVCRQERQTPKNTATATPCGLSKGMPKQKICEIHGIQMYVADIKISHNIGKYRQISQHTIRHILHKNKF